MAVLKIRDATGVIVNVLVSGTGTELDPYIPEHSVSNFPAGLATEVTAAAIEGGIVSLAAKPNLTDAELRAADLKVTLDSETVTIANPGLTDTQLRAGPVPISGVVNLTGLNDYALSQMVIDIGDLAYTLNRLKSGQSNMAGSLPVVMAGDQTLQVNVLTPGGPVSVTDVNTGYCLDIDAGRMRVDLNSDLRFGARSLTLTLATGLGSVPIPDTVTIIGIRPWVSIDVRVGFELQEPNGTATGNALETDLALGLPIDPIAWTWFKVGSGTSRTLYLSGGASDVIDIGVM